MADLRFTKDHEWVRLEGDVATVGITSFAQDQLGDVVFVELPAVGKNVEQGKDAAVVESVKAASEVYAPLDGEVTETNDKLVSEPALVNEDPMAGAWFFKLRIADKAQFDGLMDQGAYDTYVKGLA